MSDFVNLTRSPLTIVTESGDRILLPMSGVVTDVKKIVRSVYVSDGTPVTDVSYEMRNVPSPSDDRLWVVSWKSLMTMLALGYDVSDVYAPDTFIRDGSGKVIGARTLSRVVT